MAKAKILIAEDEPASRVGLQELLAGWGYEVTAAADGQEAPEKASDLQPSLIIADLVMPKMDGITLLRTLKTDATLPSLIILTGQGTIETAVQAMQEGAYDYLTKPVDVGRLRVLVEKAIERGAVLKEVTLLRHQVRHLGRFGRLVGGTRAMKEVYRLLELAAPSTAPVLIWGESGTGKELAARTIHELSPRKDGPFVPINCAAIPETLLESEIFGHEKGAFTGATERRMGCFELADQGTIFLDEVAEMKVATQAKFLRILEEGSFRRLGGTKEIRVDVRVVTATNKVSCAEGDTGYVYRGKLDFEVVTTDMGNLPEIPVKVMMNVGNPELAFEFAQIPNAGVGLARLEFVINNMIGIHPKAILDLSQVPASLRDEILRRSRGYATPKQFFIEKLVEGVATIAAAFYPKPVIVRLSDFKSNEYRKLLGGDIYEPEEENPMLGFRGASRYIAHSFRDCFEMECAAMKKVRNELGLTNVQLMVPFVRNVEEAAGVEKLLAQHGLARGQNDLKLIMMCEIPSNALLAEAFLEHFDGFSIGSNDLTQLTLGLDRDSGLVAHAFDERDPAVKQLLSMAVATCNRLGKYVGICGQGPSDHPDLAEWLMDQGIQTISLNPDTVVDTWLKLAEHSA